MKERIQWIDFGKGFTIFFVLVIHAFEGVYNTGLFANYSKTYFFLMFVIDTFIMPCFFALSGFLYKSPNSFKNFKNEIVKKGINLLIPYIIFSIIFVVLQHFSDVNNLYSWSKLLTIFYVPIGYLWFLYALFLIFIYQVF